MKKFILIIFCLVVITFTSCSKNNLSENISINHSEKTYKLSETKYIFLQDENFDIKFDNLKKNQNIYLFAYYDDSFINKYTLPVKANNTEIFNQGMAMAEKPLKKEKGYTLTINQIHTMHCIGEDRRLNDQTSATIPVRAISDSTGLMDDKIYLLFYVDYKNDKIIEENELAWIELILPYDSRKALSNATEADFSDEKRAYISSNGHRIKKENYHGKNFKAYYIRGKNDLEKLKKRENRTFENIEIGDYIYGLEAQKEKFDTPTVLLMVPEGLSLYNNPFRIKGDKTIYFEVIPEPNEKYIDFPASVRFLRIKEDMNVEKIAFYYDGKILPAEPEILK